MKSIAKVVSVIHNELIYMNELTVWLESLTISCMLANAGHPHLRELGAFLCKQYEYKEQLAHENVKPTTRSDYDKCQILAVEVTASRIRGR